MRDGWGFGRGSSLFRARQSPDATRNAMGHGLRPQKNEAGTLGYFTPQRTRPGENRDTCVATATSCPREIRGKQRSGQLLRDFTGAMACRRRRRRQLWQTAHKGAL